MQEIKQLAMNIPNYKTVLFTEFKKFVENYGIRPSSRIIGINHGNLHKIINGKEVSLETLAVYVLKFINYEESE